MRQITALKNTICILERHDINIQQDIQKKWQGRNR